MTLDVDIPIGHLKPKSLNPLFLNNKSKVEIQQTAVYAKRRTEL